MSSATLTKTGRAALALAVGARPLHLAWGVGDPAWDEPGAELPALAGATALTAEIGRRAPAFIGFVEPDENGGVAIPVGQVGTGGPVGTGGTGADETVQVARYRQVEGPTPFLYMRVNYDYEDAANAVIREMGVFMDTRLNPDLPPGQRYFRPGELAGPGLLLAAEIFRPAMNRSPSIRQSVEFVLAI